MNSAGQGLQVAQCRTQSLRRRLGRPDGAVAEKTTIRAEDQRVEGGRYLFGELFGFLAFDQPAFFLEPCELRFVLLEGPAHRK